MKHNIQVFVLPSTTIIQIWTAFMKTISLLPPLSPQSVSISNLIPPQPDCHHMQKVLYGWQMVLNNGEVSGDWLQWVVLVNLVILVATGSNWL